MKKRKRLQLHDWEKPQFRGDKNIYFIYIIESKRRLSKEEEE